MPKKVPSNQLPTNSTRKPGRPPKGAERVFPSAEPELSEVGNRLVAARERAGLDRQAAADKLGCGYQSLYDLESGKRHPSLERLLQIANAWGVDPASLDERLAGGDSGSTTAAAGSSSAGSSRQMAKTESSNDPKPRGTASHPQKPAPHAVSGSAPDVKSSSLSRSSGSTEPVPTQSDLAWKIAADLAEIEAGIRRKRRVWEELADQLDKGKLRE